MAINFKGGLNVGGGIGFSGGPQSKGVADPLADVEYTDDLAVDAARELSALEQAYRDRAKAEASRFTAATDSEFWVAVCFTSREEKEAFLAEFGLMRHGDKYLDGGQVAKTLRKRERG